MTGTVDRRKFLRAAGVTAVGAAVAGVGGEILLGKQFRGTPPPAAVAPSAPSAASPSMSPPPQLKIHPMTPLPADETLDSIAGLSPFYTPNKEFYRIDTSLVLPKVSPADWQLRIHGMVDRPLTLSYDDLIRLPMIDRDITLTCVSESVGGNYVGNARWQGTLLAPILRKAGVRSANTAAIALTGEVADLSSAAARVETPRTTPAARSSLTAPTIGPRRLASRLRACSARQRSG